MNYNETERVMNWTQKKRGRFSALATALGFDRRVLHDRLSNYRMVSIDFEVVKAHQISIELEESNSKKLLASLKIWLEQRENRKKSLAEYLQKSNALITKWIKADAEDTCLLGWVNQIKAALPNIEIAERNNYGENRRISNRLVKKQNTAKAYAINELVELARVLLQFSNADIQTATIFFTKGKIVAAGWSINSLSSGYEESILNSNQGEKNVSSVDICYQAIENKHKSIDTVISIGKLNLMDIALLEKANPRVIFHNLENDKVINILRDKNITVCKL